ncbi:MAG: non-ribosomal peptide synthetase [Pseudomonadota bacterium]
MSQLDDPLCIDIRSEENLLLLGCGSPLPNEERTPVHKLVKLIARRVPQQIALVDNVANTSYSRLSVLSSRITLALGANGIAPGDRVGLLVRPSSAMIIAIMAILDLDAVYVPLDQGQPDQRINKIVSDANLKAFLSDQDGSLRLHKSKIPVYNIDELLLQDNGSSNNLKVPLNVASKEIAYLIYTSGSTGKPKGVVINHSQLSESTLARRVVYPGQHTFLLVSPLACDSSVAGIWGTLTSGGKLILPAQEQIRDPIQLVELIKAHEVNQILCVPSLYDAILDCIDKNGLGNILRSLTEVIVAGEKLPQPLIDKHFSVFGESAVSLVNEYGPTETTVWATYQRYNSRGITSIGKPIPGIKLYILDKNMRLLPRGEIGELFIGGMQVAEGYFSRPEATEKVFLKDEFSTESGARMYRTGDLVRWNDDNTLHYVGRKDYQIKIRGYRVELGEIESALYSISIAGIKNVVVMANDDATELHAFINSDTSLHHQSLRKELLGKLPSYMVPTQFHVTKQFPLTISGKVDREKLKDSFMNTSLLDSQNSSITEVVEDKENVKSIFLQVSAAWREILNLEAVASNTNFFDLGGHSLLVFRLQEAIERYTRRNISIVSLYQYTTIASQVEYLTNLGSEISAVSTSLELRPKRRRTRIARSIANKENMTEVLDR